MIYLHFPNINADVMPPTIICPQNFSVPMVDDDDYAIVKIFPAPNVTGMLFCECSDEF